MILNFLNNKPKKRIFGVDIGAKNTALMSFQLKDGKPVVDHLLITNTPSQAFTLGAVSDEQILSDFLAEQISNLDLEEISIIMGLSGKGMITKKIEIPIMEDYMIPEYIEIEAEQELFYNKEEMNLDYHILNDDNFDKSDSKSVFVVTTSQKVVNSYMNVVPEHVTSCEIIDTNIAALFNIFEYNKNLDSKKVYMVIDLGCSMTNIIVIVNKQLVFVRSVSVGGDFYTQAIQKQMSIDYQSAENLKVSASQGESSPEELVSYLKNELNENFVEELSSCYELYLSLFPEKPISEVYITGGASQTVGLAEAIQHKLNAPINWFNPFEKLSFKPELKTQKEHYHHLSSVVAGLCLRSLK